MSDNMSSREIEDVLSSIRRLVTEDLRPVARAEAAVVPVAEARRAPATPLPERAAPQDSAPEKLLLTPSLRVVGGKAADLAPAPEPVPEPVEEAPFIDMPAEAADDPANEPWLDSIVAALGEAARARPQEWEPELGDPAPEAPARIATARIAPLRPVELKLASVTPDLPKPAASRPAFPPAWAQPVPLEPVEATHRPDPTPEPRRDPVWLDRAEAEVRAALDEMPKTERMPSPDAALPDDEAELSVDADQLQLMVREIIREELAGPLGERITRNIRKMVHAEIARALAARDYD